MNVPFVDLKAQYQSIKEEMDTAIQGVLDETAFIKGKHVTQFEKSYQSLFGIKNCIGVANGTDAIYVTLKTLGIGKGDEVITVANSWISTSETITQTGATPVFVDIHPDTYVIDVTKIEEKITSNTKAIVPVHLFGHPAPMDEIMQLCKQHELVCVEDCAQAHLAEYKGQKVGTIGHAGAFSFFPGKNLGAYGDAGGIITNDDELAKKARMYANHGALVKHQHKIEGINSRLDGLQAAVLNVKLKYLEKWTEQRRENAAYYNKVLADLPGVTLPIEADDVKHAYHLYVVRVQNREQLQQHLKDKGISTGVHYPTPLPLLEAYSYLGMTSQDIPVAADYQSQILSLPMYPELTTEQIDHIKTTIASFQG